MGLLEFVTIWLLCAICTAFGWALGIQMERNNPATKE